MISKEEFQLMLTPERKKFILEAIRGGVEDYNNPAFYGAEARLDHIPRVRANLRNCHIVGRARRALTGRTDMRVINKRGRVLFIIADTCQVSFKKLDARLHSSNVPTQQSLAFNGQTFDTPPLFGHDMPLALTNLIAGYRYLNRDSESDYEIYITCPCDQDNYWVWKLSGAEISDFLTYTIEADTIGTIQLTPRKRRIQIRADANRKEQESN